jgi:arsenate reductase
MAEGFARELGKGLIAPHSAGLSPRGVNPRAVAVMQEIGVNIAQQTSKSIDEDLLKNMDIIITLCDNAAEACPWTPPGIRKMHWPLEDPARAEGTEEEIMHEFRKIRDEIKERILYLMKEVQNG